MNKKQIGLTIGFAMFVVTGAVFIALAGGVVWGTPAAGFIAAGAFLVSVVLAPVFGAAFGE